MADVSDAKLSMILLAVNDVSRSAAFYEAAFGWKRRTDVPVLVEFDLADGGALAVYQRDGFSKNTGRIPTQAAAHSTSATELYFHVEDLDQSIERLRKAGARVLVEKCPRPWGDEAAYFADPDGNVVVVARPLTGEIEDTLPPAIVLEREVEVGATAMQVFDAFTTLEGVKSFLAPDARMDRTVGGAYEMYFLLEAPEGSRGSEGCTFLHLDPPEHLAFSWNFPPTLPSIRNEHTRVDLRLEALSPSVTRVHLKQSGWKSGGEWEEGLAYFDRAWELVLSRLERRFREGPLGWSASDS